MAHSTIACCAARSLFRKYLELFGSQVFNILTLETSCLSVLEGNGEVGVAGNAIGMLALDQGGWMQRGRKAEGARAGVLSEPLQEQGVFAMM